MNAVTRPDPQADLQASRRLAERVFDALPVTQLAFLKLLSLLEIRADRTIPTACVTLGARARLRINPDFVRDRCATDEALVMLVLHELYHVLLGHTRLYRRVTPAQNWAFDAVINAHLCQLFPGPAHTALFRASYRADRFPEALLRPPVGWRTDAEHWALEGAAREAHRALYTESSATYAELLTLLERTVAVGDAGGARDGSGAGAAGEAGDAGGAGDPGEGRLAVEALLGSHASGPDGEADGEGADPELLAEIRDLVARWPMQERRSGRDLGGARAEERLDPRRPERAAVAAIRRALLPLLDLGEGGSGPAALVPAAVDGVLPYRSGPDRRAAVREGLGLAPLHWAARLPHRAPGRCERVHVYVDVSGSMRRILPLLYGALLPLRGWLHPELHLFSTAVANVRPEALGRGRVATTWGTDIACVTAHLRAHRVRRALILTDGWVGPMPSEDRVALRRRRLRAGVVLTQGGDPAFAAELGARVSRLPELNP